VGGGILTLTTFIGEKRDKPIDRSIVFFTYMEKEESKGNKEIQTPTRQANYKGRKGNKLTKACAWEKPKSYHTSSETIE